MRDEGEGNGEKWRRTGDDVDIAARGHGEEEGRTEEKRKGRGQEEESQTGKERQVRRGGGKMGGVYVRAQIENFKILPGNASVQQEGGERKEQDERQRPRRSTVKEGEVSYAQRERTWRAYVDDDGSDEAVKGK
jgi:hypothetical protein